MARATFIDSPEFMSKLSKLVDEVPEVAEKALKAGADVVADRMRSNLQGVLSPNNTGQLLDSFGISKMKQQSNGDYDVSVGFGGYQQPGTGKFRATGVPFQLIARSFESGAVRGSRRSAENRKKKKSELKGLYWREPTHFASKAINATREKANEAMKATVEEELNKKMNGGI